MAGRTLKLVAGVEVEQLVSATDDTLELVAAVHPSAFGGDVTRRHSCHQQRRSTAWRCDSVEIITLAGVAVTANGIYNG